MGQNKITLIALKITQKFTLLYEILNLFNFYIIFNSFQFIRSELIASVTFNLQL